MTAGMPPAAPTGASGRNAIETLHRLRGAVEARAVAALESAPADQGIAGVTSVTG